MHHQLLTRQDPHYSNATVGPRATLELRVAATRLARGPKSFDSLMKFLIDLYFCLVI